jgi:hypothetical protein
LEKYIVHNILIQESLFVLAPYDHVRGAYLPRYQGLAVASAVPLNALLERSGNPAIGANECLAHVKYPGEQYSGEKIEQ